MQAERPGGQQEGLLASAQAELPWQPASAVQAQRELPLRQGREVSAVQAQREFPSQPGLEVSVVLELPELPWPPEQGAAVLDVRAQPEFPSQPEARADGAVRLQDGPAARARPEVPRGVVQEPLDAEPKLGEPRAAVRGARCAVHHWADRRGARGGDHREGLRAADPWGGLLGRGRLVLVRRLVRPEPAQWRRSARKRPQGPAARSSAPSSPAAGIEMFSSDDVPGKLKVGESLPAGTSRPGDEQSAVGPQCGDRQRLSGIYFRRMAA